MKGILRFKMGQLALIVHGLKLGRAYYRKDTLSRLPSEPAKRLLFSPTIRQRASGTRVSEGFLRKRFRGLIFGNF